MNNTKTRYTEITVETRSLTIIKMSGGKRINFFYCRKCRIKTAGFVPAQAVLIFRATALEIERHLQTGQIHTNGDSALCGNSLAGFFKQEVRFIED